METITSSSEFIDVSVDADGILCIRLQRPQRKNALNLAMYQALSEILAVAVAEDHIKLLLIQGSDDCFCSGNDLQEFIEFSRQQDPGALDAERSPIFQFMRALVYCDKPVVAQVCGPAIGIGATLLLYCDLVLAAESAYLQFPFTQLGLCPEFASSLLLPERIGQQRAAQVLFYGEKISARLAQEWGLVNAVFAAEALAEQVQLQCRQLAAQPQNALKITKHLLRQNQREQVTTTIENEIRYFVRLLKSEEFAKVSAQFTAHSGQ